MAGIVRLFVKGAQEKAREKIKATYGVDISDKGVLKQIGGECRYNLSNVRGYPPHKILKRLEIA